MYFSPSAKQFFDSQVVPDAFEVTNEIHNYILDQLRLGKVIDVDQDGMPIAVTPVRPTQPETVESVYLDQLRKLNEAYETAANQLKFTYPTTETDTWYMQFNEAITYKQWMVTGSVGEPPSTPFLSILLASRQEGGVPGDMADLVARVLGLNAIYTPLLARLTGMRHVADKALKVAKAVDDIAALKLVSWDFMSIFQS